MINAAKAGSRLGWIRRGGRWLLVALAFLHLAQPGALGPSPVAASERTSDPFVHFRLAGEDYCVPAGYLNRPLAPGLDQHGVLIEAWLPDLEPRHLENREATTDQDAWRRRIDILVTVTRNPASSLARRYETWSSRYGPFEPIGHAHGRTVMSNQEHSPHRRRELYIHSSGDLRAGFSFCVFRGPIELVECRHVFLVSDRFVVAAFYGHAFLPEWEAIAERVEDLFSEFRTADNCHGTGPG